MKKIVLIFCMLAISSNGFAADKPIRQAQDRSLKVVATTTYFADLIKQIGGEHVTVHAVASPKFNVHFAQPRPSDVARTVKADLFVFSGLDLEAWADPLLEASGRHDLFRGSTRNLDLSQGIELKKMPQILTRAEGDLHAFGNPHYTLNPENARLMAQTASRKLQEIDPANSVTYAKNENEFLARLNQKISEWKSLCMHCAGEELIAYHDDVVYLTDFLGMKEGQYLEPKPGVPPSPKHLSFLEEYAASKRVRIVSSASYHSKKMLMKLADKIKARPVTVIQNPGEIKNTETIFDFYEYNVKTIADALKV